MSEFEWEMLSGLCVSVEQWGNHTDNNQRKKNCRFHNTLFIPLIFTSAKVQPYFTAFKQWLWIVPITAIAFSNHQPIQRSRPPAIAPGKRGCIKGFWQNIQRGRPPAIAPGRRGCIKGWDARRRLKSNTAATFRLWGFWQNLQRSRPPFRRPVKVFRGAYGTWGFRVDHDTWR